MALTNLKEELFPPPQNSPAKLASKGDTLDAIKSTHTEELVFALCGPIGSPLSDVSEKLQEVLRVKFKYDVNPIKLSKIIEGKTGFIENGVRQLDRINKLIEEGNALRKEYGNGILAELAVAQIHIKRCQSDGEDFKPRRICHIIDSIKNEQELELLRLVYGDIFYCVGVFSSTEERKKLLEDRFGMSRWEIEKLIDRDSGEEIDNGQTVRDTFPKSDYFMRLPSNIGDEADTQVARFLNLVTKIKIVTPTKDEAAMYVAASAALNSSCLSRQVGAAITDEKGGILGTGWNEVPRANGGVYPADGVDHRCMKSGTCYNQIEKQKIAASIADLLVEKKILSPKKKNEAIASLLNSKIKDLIEFSRSVHAEVHAIINASQTAGTQMRGGRLYCTTYPCHSCARHIIASGIKDVYFIEPYRKSLALRLHGDALTEDEKDRSKVRLLPYEGASPRRYYDFYQAKSNRKSKTGNMPALDAASIKPGTPVSIDSIPFLEGIVLAKVSEKGFDLDVNPQTL